MGQLYEFGTGQFTQPLQLLELGTNRFGGDVDYDRFTDFDQTTERTGSGFNAGYEAGTKGFFE